MAKKKTISSPSLFEPGVAPVEKNVERLEDIVANVQKIEKDRQAAKVRPAEPVKTIESVVIQNKTLGGSEALKIGDECTINDHVLPGILKEPHAGKTFIIETMIPWVCCASGTLVIAHEKNNPDKRTTGIGGKGIDAGWFLPVASNEN